MAKHAAGQHRPHQHSRDRLRAAARGASVAVAFAVAVVLAQAIVLWSGVLVLQLLSSRWRVSRKSPAAAAALLLRAIPIIIVATFPRSVGAAPSTVPQWPTAAAGFACLVLAW